MKKGCLRNNSCTAFTLVELLAVIIILALLSCLLVPAMARAKIKSPAAGCLSNMRQLMVGWSMYKEENNDSLMPNYTTSVGPVWVPSIEQWSALDGNTNVAALLSGVMGSYVQNDVTVFKCPADVVPSVNGQRLRSYSMNGQMGIMRGSPESQFNSGYAIYSKGSDLTCPVPSNAFVFCDEWPGSIDDSYLQLQCIVPGYPNAPAAYMGGACGFSFADGHGEIHKWQTSTLLQPVVQGVGLNGTTLPSNVHDVDWLWLRVHATCKIQ